MSRLLEGNKLLFATTNEGKLKEVRQFLEGIDVVSLSDLGITDDVEETEKHYSGNALLKAQHLFDKVGIPVVADDSGIDVDSLYGYREENMTFPSVYSARAFSDHDDDKNVKGLLNALKEVGVEESTARYVTILCYLDGTEPMYVRRTMEGVVYADKEPIGDNGFAYDTIFYPYLEDGEVSSISYAEMTNEQKNSLSHRVKALKGLRDNLS